MWRNSAVYTIFSALWKYSQGHHNLLVLSVALTTIDQLLNLFSPFAIGKIINILQMQGQDGINHAMQWLIALAVVIATTIIINQISRWIDRLLKLKIDHAYLQDFYKKAHSLPLLWHQDNHSGEMISRLNKASSAMNNFINFPSQYLWLVIGFFGPAIIIVTLMPSIGIAALIVCLAIIAFTVVLDRKVKIRSKESNDTFHKVFTALTDYLGNIRTVIILHLGAQTSGDIKKRLQDNETSYHKETHISIWRNLSTESLIEITILTCIIFTLLAFRKPENPVQVGTLVMMINYLRQMSFSIYNYSRSYSNTVRALADYEGIMYLNNAYDEHVKNHKENQLSDTAWSQITVEKLHFLYNNDKTKTALDQLSFHLFAGQKIALVGESGAGKSTLMSVLRGLYPAQGHCVIDETRYPSLDPLSEISTLIPQDPEIFENTIRYNITLGVEHSDKSILDACRIACFDTVLNNLPNGLDSKINEKGVNLSGGQKQRLALARGIFAIKDSSLVLFDEPTSSVDSMTERQMYKNLFQAFPDICLISSIHRLNLLTQFDAIWVMEHGKLVQQGSLQELLAQTGQPFEKLWNAYQSEDNV